MTLEDFEKQLAAEKEADQKRERRREKDYHQHQHQHQRHHHRRSSREKNHEHDEDHHRSKRRRRDDSREDRHRHRQKHHRRLSHRDETEDTSHTTKPDDVETSPTNLKRDAWMEAPTSIDIDYVQRRQEDSAPPKQSSLSADFELKIHERELNHHLRDYNESENFDEIVSESRSHEVNYTFGDASSKSRMTRLRAVYRESKQSGRSVEEVALERYDNLCAFDDAREEEAELERRDTYGRDYVGKEKPTGELFRERKQNEPRRTQSSQPEYERAGDMVEGVTVPSAPASGTGQRVIDQTILNKMRAQLMKAQLRKDPNLGQLQKEYDDAAVAFTTQDPTLVTLSAMDSRMLSSAPRHEVKSVQNRRGAERGQVEENDEMSIEDMVREERRTKGQGYGEAKRFAERIAKDGKFDNDLEYMDENAAKLAKRVHKSDGDLRNVAINEYQKLNKVLDNCPLCHHEDSDTPPVAPVVSLATRTYLTLPTEPELASFSAMIVPIQHRTNLMEADDDEWEEIRNFMKSLTRFYHDQGRDVIFYENAAHPHKKPHAALTAVPLPYGQGETAPAFFKEAFLTTEDEWSQHKKIIDTLAKSKQGLGKLAFRRTFVKEMPYFHVWFEMDGGLGHIVEEANRWPRGDLFAREIIGGMLGLELDVIKRQGRWHRGRDSRLAGFQKKWQRFDWTRILLDG